MPNVVPPVAFFQIQINYKWALVVLYEEISRRNRNVTPHRAELNVSVAKRKLSYILAGWGRRWRANAGRILL